MATAYLRRPKNVEIEDRTEALATLEQVLDADCVETWAQFRYRLLPCGVERDSAEATGRGGHRDLETLTLHETGSGGLDEVRSQLPPHEEGSEEEVAQTDCTSAASASRICEIKASWARRCVGW